VTETKQLEVEEIIKKIQDNESKRTILERDMLNLVRDWVISELSLQGSGFNWTVYIGKREAGEVRVEEDKIYFVQS